MSHSLNRVLLHIVFCTKYREARIDEAIRLPLQGYISGIVTHQRGRLLAAGSMPDHVHLLVVLPPTLTVAQLVQKVKQDSSKWIKSQGAAYRNFRWKPGYFACSVSPRYKDVVKGYIQNQKEIHARRAYKKEFAQLLKNSHIDE